jgi:hypothetical protein
LENIAEGDESAMEQVIAYVVDVTADEKPRAFARFLAVVVIFKLSSLIAPRTARCLFDFPSVAGKHGLAGLRVWNM